jgi:hypothetical protein
MLNADSLEIKDFISAWHELRRDDFELRYPDLDYDANSPISAHTREKYIEIVMLDHGGRSHNRLVDRLTHEFIDIEADEVKRGCRIEVSTASYRNELERERDFDPEFGLSGRRRPLTSREYAAVQQAYDVFNHELFEGKLPAVEFVLLSQPRWAYDIDFTFGYFRSQRFTGRKGLFGTIALNRSPIVTEEGILSTLAHEMVHVWQFAFDRPRPGAHNRDWGEKMRSIGLDPVENESLSPRDSKCIPGTGEHKRLKTPDGRDGSFALACRKLGFKLKWEACTRCRRNSYLSGSGVLLCAACERICAARETQLLLNFTDNP